MNIQLKKLSDFLRSVKKTPIDLQIVQSPGEWLDPLLGVNAKNFFNIYFRNAAGDLVGEWDADGKFLDDESYPIVWLSSEGSPQTVVAKDAEQFLSILPYGQGIITGIPVLIEKHKQRPGKVVAPEVKFKKSAIEEAFKYQSEQFEGHAELVEFITKTLKIKLDENPLITIKEAVEQFPPVENWIEEHIK